jgi:MoxR-like ATPase
VETTEQKLVRCGECGRTYRIKAEMIGKKIKCQCGVIGAPVLVDANGTPLPVAPASVPAEKNDGPAATGRDAGATPVPKNEDDIEAVRRLQSAFERIRRELSKSIIGQSKVIEEVMIGIFARGHCLLEGVPGLAKTLLISSLARTLSLSFHRIQFTPDLMPADITGTEILQDDPATGQRNFRFMKGPIFSNIVLADEINRTPPKTQAALLEAMQEKHVSFGGTEYKLELPFFVLATQNPLDQEGTYPLPEAQLDRFLLKINVDYPSLDEEIEIMKSATSSVEPDQRSVLSRQEILDLQQLVRKVPAAEHIFHYAATLVRSTRPAEAKAPQFIKDWISFGAGPRASLNLILAGKARALLKGRFHVAVEDIQAVAPSVMRHRLGTNFAAQAEGVTTNDIVTRLLETIPADERLYERAG